MSFEIPVIETERLILRGRRLEDFPAYAAMWAHPEVVRYFLVENFLVTTAGLICGVALALGLNELLVRELEMSRLPAQYLVIGVMGLWCLGLLAALGPAWRASLISPAIATRST